MLNRSTLETQEIAINNKPNRLSVNHKITITDDGKGIARALAEKLAEKGYRATVVNEIPSESDAIVLLNGLRNFANEEEAIKSNYLAFSQVKNIATRFTHKGGLFISVQDTGGCFGLTQFEPTRRWSAGFSGLAKTAAKEWPKAYCKAIDLEQAQQAPQLLAERLLAEILYEDHNEEIGLLANGKRIKLQAKVGELSPQQLSINKESVIIVSGGARGVTAACLIALAKRTQARFVLLGRTALTDETAELQTYHTESQLRDFLIKDAQRKKLALNPQQLNKKLSGILAVREIKNTLKALTAAGSETLYFDVDVLNLEQLKATLAQVRTRWKIITGVIHGAGVLADKLIAQKTDDQFNLVFNTKVLGLQNLLAATQPDPLKLICFFSSVAARFGNAGQCDYSMANEILNKVAQYEKHQRGKECIVKSINWGPWEGGMVTPQLKAMFAQRGISILPVDQGAEFFVNELGSSDNVEVVCGSSLKATSTDGKIIKQNYIVNEAAYPMINSHIIKEKPVMPACLVLEWFINCAKRLLPAAKLVCCNNLKVLKGIVLEDYYGKGTPLNVSAEVIQQTANQQTLALKLENATGSLHYTAEIIMQSTDYKAEITGLSLTEKAAWPWSVKEIYQATNNGKQAKLFHGADFQVIQSLEAVSKQGGAGHLIGVEKKAWLNEWQIDVAAVDGILQLLILWGIHTFNNTTLPTKIGKFENIAEITSDYKCIFHCEIKDQYRFLADAVLMSADGKPYAKLTGIEMCVVT